MAEATPWQVAGAGAINPLQPTVYTTQVFSRGTEPWPYYTPPTVVTNNTGSNVAATYGVYGVNSGAPVSGGSSGGGSSGGGSTGGNGGSSGGSSGGGNAGPGTGTGGGSSGFGCCGGS